VSFVVLFVHGGAGRKQKMSAGKTPTTGGKMEGCIPFTILCITKLLYLCISFSLLKFIEDKVSGFRMTTQNTEVKASKPTGRDQRH
jgi:hypothetical protein